MTLEVSIVTRRLDNDSSRDVTSNALVTFDGQPVKNLRQRNFSLYVPARKYLDDASVWGQGFGFADTEAVCPKNQRCGVGRCLRISADFLWHRCSWSTCVGSRLVHGHP